MKEMLPFAIGVIIFGIFLLFAFTYNIYLMFIGGAMLIITMGISMLWMLLEDWREG